MTKVSCSALSVLMVVLAAAAAADVDLVTIPRREGTQLTIYNSDDITMVREHRLLTVKQGINRIQFTWAETLIDPTSIDFRILDHEDQVDLIDTTYPPGRNDALQWNIHSQFAGKIGVEIRYFTSGITWAATYVGIANQDETRMKLTGYVRVENNSGELYDNAQTRLVVGTINLVEKIADLAQRPAPEGKPQPPAEQPAREMAAAGRALMDAVVLAESKAEKAKEVIKQGLSEYFLFSIEGRETIEDREPKRLVCLDVADVPLECLYKLTDRDGGKQFTKFYRFENKMILDDQGKEKDLPSMENLGLSPLPDGSLLALGVEPVIGVRVKLSAEGAACRIGGGVDRGMAGSFRRKSERDCWFPSLFRRSGRGGDTTPRLPGRPGHEVSLRSLVPGRRVQRPPGRPPRGAPPRQRLDQPPRSTPAPGAGP